MKNKINHIVSELETKINVVVNHSITNQPLTVTKKVSKKDLKIVVEYWLYGKCFDDVKQTKLYNEQSGKYCRILELLERMNLERAN